MNSLLDLMWLALVCYAIYYLFSRGFSAGFKYVADVLRGAGQYLPRPAASALESFAQGLEESARMFSALLSPSCWHALSQAYRRGGWPAVREVWEKDERG